MVTSLIKKYGGPIIGKFNKFDQILSFHIFKMIRDSMTLCYRDYQNTRLQYYKLMFSNSISFRAFQQNSPNTGN